ncbi:hypothetical protein PTKIN_Ptkin04bG0024400 [Pterospermum kingtungense]
MFQFLSSLISMENYHILFSDGSSAAPSSLTMASTKLKNLDAMDVSHEVKVGKIGEHNNKGTVRKHKYAFQTRSQVDILDDGYRWRKYGQKTVKNSKFPRSYYKCTHKECSVKKQVQRSSKDDEIVVTTYEGMHSHPVERFTENFEHILRQMQTYN